MNYIELINWFWELDEGWQFSCCETRLYFYLLRTANRLGWESNWTHGDAKTAACVGVSINKFKAARDRISAAGLIWFRTGGKGFGDKTRYQILTPKSIPKLTPKSTPNYEPKLTPINKLKLKQKQIINPPYIPPEGEMCLDEKNESSDNSLKYSKEEKEKSSAKKEKEPKHKYGKYENVLLTDVEYSKILEQSEGNEVINHFSTLKEMKGYKYKSDYLAILKWGIKSYEEEKKRNGNRQLPANNQVSSGKFGNNPIRNDAENKRAELNALEDLAEAILRRTGPSNG